MFTLSYISAILGSCALFFFGWLVNKLIAGRNAEDWKPQMLELEKVNKSQEKQIKKEKSQVEQLRKKSESWKHEFHALTQENQLKAKEVRLQIEALQAELTQRDSAYAKLKLEFDKKVTMLERLQKENEKLKLKYATDVEAGKEWRRDRQVAERTIKDLTSKLEKQTVLTNDYQKKYDKQAEEISQIRVMQRELRLANTKIKTLNKDVEYWEKKHYDAHHELAVLKKEQDEISIKFQEIEALRKGDEILKTNLMEQISEFKTKFVDVNNKYREILNSNN